jgi:hypothetical protein
MNVRMSASDDDLIPILIVSIHPTKEADMGPQQHLYINKVSTRGA